MTKHRCPIVLNFDVLEKRWTVRMLRLLYASPMQFNELKRRLRGITPAVLASRLKELEKRRLVARSPMPAQRHATRYSVTATTRGMFDCWAEK